MRGRLRVTAGPAVRSQGRGSGVQARRRAFGAVFGRAAAARTRGAHCVCGRGLAPPAAAHAYYGWFRACIPAVPCAFVPPGRRGPPSLTSIQLDEQKAFYERQADRDATTDAKTAKNRAKRDKRKAARKGGSKDPARVAAAAAPLVSKFAFAASGVPASIFFKQPREDGMSDGESGAAEGDAGPAAPVTAPGSIPEPLPDALVGSAEVQITVHDDD